MITLGELAANTGITEARLRAIRRGEELATIREVTDIARNLELSNREFVELALFAAELSPTTGVLIELWSGREPTVELEPDPEPPEELSEEWA